MFRHNRWAGLEYRSTVGVLLALGPLGDLPTLADSAAGTFEWRDALSFDVRAAIRTYPLQPRA